MVLSESDSPKRACTGKTERYDRRRGGAVLDPGMPAPEFSLPDQDGATVNLADQRGHWALLWWYPKAATPG